MEYKGLNQIAFLRCATRFRCCYVQMYELILVLICSSLCCTGKEQQYSKATSQFTSTTEILASTNILLTFTSNFENESIPRDPFNVKNDSLPKGDTPVNSLTGKYAYL